MPVMLPHHCPQVPPRNSLAGTSPGYIRSVEYVNSSGVAEGMRTEMKVYNGTGGATVKGGVYVINFDGDEETMPRLATVAAATVNKYVGVATEAAADTTWTWVGVAGEIDALVDGDTTDVVKDDYLGLVTATNADAFIRDGAGTAMTTDSFAIACAGNATTETLTKVVLLGLPADID